VPSTQSDVFAERSPGCWGREALATRGRDEAPSGLKKRSDRSFPPPPAAESSSLLPAPALVALQPMSCFFSLAEMLATTSWLDPLRYGTTKSTPPLDAPAARATTLVVRQPFGLATSLWRLASGRDAPEQAHSVPTWRCGPAPDATGCPLSLHRVARCLRSRPRRALVLPDGRRCRRLNLSDELRNPRRAGEVTVLCSGWKGCGARPRAGDLSSTVRQRRCRT